MGGVCFASFYFDTYKSLTWAFVGQCPAPNYVVEVAIGSSQMERSQILPIKGVSSSIYYLSAAIVGAFVGGWIADRIGRINGVFLAAIFALAGGALQAATQSSDFILVARVVTGLGTGAPHCDRPGVHCRSPPQQVIVEASLDTCSLRTT